MLETLKAKMYNSNSKVFFRKFKRNTNKFWTSNSTFFLNFHLGKLKSQDYEDVTLHFKFFLI